MVTADQLRDRLSPRWPRHADGTTHDLGSTLQEHDVPRCSFVVVARSQCADVKATLTALEQLTYPRACREVIVVDRASGDTTVDEVRARFPHVRLVRIERDDGHAAAVGRGLKVADGELVALLDPGVEPQPTWAIEGARLFGYRPRLAAVAGRAQAAAARAPDHGLPHPLRADAAVEPVLPTLLCDLRALMLRREAVIGKLPVVPREQLGLELGIMLWLAGWEQLYVPACISRIEEESATVDAAAASEAVATVLRPYLEPPEPGQTIGRAQLRELLRLLEQSVSTVGAPVPLLAPLREVIDVVNEAEPALTKTRVLIVSRDRFDPKMSGPAIRCWEMAKLLADDHDVTLASSQTMRLSHPSFRTLEIGDSLLPALEEADVVIFQGFVMHFYPEIESADVPVLVDIYDPFHLEGLELRRYAPAEQRFLTMDFDVEVLNRQLRRADFLVCATEKQRDFWLGQLAGQGRINPPVYDEDESLRTLLDVAPFGLPEQPPEKREQVLKGVRAGIAPDDFLLLWGGGIYNWFDPLTLIRAVGEVVKSQPQVKLFFLGSAHPNPDVPQMHMATAAYRLAEDLGLLDSSVFFNPGWVDYERRGDYLLEADVGVSTHFLHLETAYSFRTRMLDYLWAELPVLATAGDALSDLVRERKLGIVVPPEDVAATAKAIRRLATDQEFVDACRQRISALAPELTWRNALAPVEAFCGRPRRAADRRIGEAPRVRATPSDAVAQGGSRLRAIVRSLARRSLTPD